MSIPKTLEFHRLEISFEGRYSMIAQNTPVRIIDKNSVGKSVDKDLQKSNVTENGILAMSSQ